MSANVGENASPFVDQLADGPGASRIDPTDPAAPMYRLLALMRSPVALRDLMLQPVRTGYIGQEKRIDPAELPKSAADLYPDIRVSELDVPSPLGRIRCQVYSPPRAAARRAMMLYAHGGGFTLGQAERANRHPGQPVEKIPSKQRRCSGGETVRTGQLVDRRGRVGGNVGEGQPQRSTAHA